MICSNISDYYSIYYLYFVIELNINVTCNSSTVEAFSRGIFPTKNTHSAAGVFLITAIKMMSDQRLLFQWRDKGPYREVSLRLACGFSARREKLSAFTFYKSASTAPGFSAIPDDCETRQFFACSPSKKPLQSDVSETNERETERGGCEASLATQQQLHFNVEANVLRYSL